MDIAQNLKDAGCGADTASTVCRLYGAGDLQGAVAVLRRCRRGLMESLHESQERVDCLDYLLYRLEKMINEEKNSGKGGL